VSGPAIIQSDRSVLLEVAHPDFEDARRALAGARGLTERQVTPFDIDDARLHAGATCATMSARSG